MKFRPRQLSGNVNVSLTSPIRELFLLLGAILGALVFIYFVLGFALDILVDRLPVRTEKKLVDFFDKKFRFENPSTPAEKAAQKIVDELTAYLPENDFRFRVHIVEKKEANAFAMPGGNIVLNSGLFKAVQSENELTMILAHELGHYIHRDHLRGLGRGLALSVMSSFFLGADSEVTQFLMRSLLTTDLRFSRRQEAFADQFALDLLVKKYGHAGGATDFFERHTYYKNFPKFFNFFLTHPYDYYRINAIVKQIALKGYKIGEKVPIDPVFKTEKKKK